MYFPVTVTVRKGGVCLLETDCEACLEWSVDRYGNLEWDISEFHFDGLVDGKKTYTKITRPEPLFAVLYGAANMERLEQRLRDELLANDYGDFNA